MVKTIKNYIPTTHYALIRMKSNYNLLEDPSPLIDRKIEDLGERLLDFMPKYAKHCSIPNAKPLEDSTDRILKYTINEKNGKIHSMILLVHDIPYERKRNIQTYIREDLNCEWIQTTQNLMMFGWKTGTNNILKLAEAITFLGKPEMYIHEQ